LKRPGFSYSLTTGNLQRPSGYGRLF
jgi:hypothetical protein